MEYTGTITDSLGNVSNIVLIMQNSNNDLYIGLILGALVGITFWLVARGFI